MTVFSVGLVCLWKSKYEVARDDEEAGQLSAAILWAEIVHNLY